jgi:hypothetical protein
MTAEPFRGAFPHQHGDPHTLMERIDAQIRDRIEEAVEMAALELLVETRKREQRRAPQEDSASDRAEFRALAERLLAHLHDALVSSLPDEQRPALEGIDPPPSSDWPGLLTVQVFLAKRLPDYWQRFDEARGEFARQSPGAPGPGPGWLRRLFGS